MGKTQKHDKGCAMLVKVELCEPVRDELGIFPEIEHLWFDPKDLCKLREPCIAKAASEYKVDLKCFVELTVSYKECWAVGVWPVAPGRISIDRLEACGKRKMAF